MDNVYVLILNYITNSERNNRIRIQNGTIVYEFKAEQSYTIHEIAGLDVHVGFGIRRSVLRAGIRYDDHFSTNK